MNVETVVKLDRFKPRKYQMAVLDAVENKGYRGVIAVWPRRAGKDIMAFNLAIRFALKKVCVVYYILPTYTMARKIIWDNITIDGHRIIDWFLPEELVESKNGQEMKIRLKNGSLIQLLGSDNADGLVGTNPSLCVFSEYALQDPTAYQFIRPILAANDGTALFVSCVAPNTLVLTKDGFKRISAISESRKEYTDLNEPIYGLCGFNNAEQYYYGGKQKTLKIELASGYSLECTPVHPVWNGHEWIKSADLKVGDLIPVQYGQDVWGNGVDFSGFSYSGKHNHHWNFDEADLGEDFFYLLGLIHADGNYNENTVCVTKKKDQPIIDFLLVYGFRTRRDDIHHEFSSRSFCSLLEYLGFKHGARVKSFPEKLFSCTKSQMKAFLQGIFDGDGSSNSFAAKRGNLKLTSTCIDFVKDLQVVLLNFGVVSSITTELKAPTKLVTVESRIYNLEISGHFAYIFYRDIGFRLERKQANSKHIVERCKEESGNVYPVMVEKLGDYTFPRYMIENPSRISRRLIKQLNDKKNHPYLESLLAEKLFYSPIKSIEKSESEVFDFVIPNTHSFVSNGLLSHNTPRGHNHFHQLFQMASRSKDWFTNKLTLDDTQHIPLEEVERDRAEGLMSEDLIQQELYTSWDMGIEGSYYSKYLDKMRIRGQITTVPWENGFKVHTAWDLGIRDSTCIIFFQTIGSTIRIIDCYENSGVGLEHYAKVLQQKPYQYGKHFAPHDIKVREFGTGITRLEKGRQLGISFLVAPDVGIEDGIEAVRSSLTKIWIDDKNCKKLLDALESYHQEFNPKLNAYNGRPVHDWSSHYADTMRYLCVCLNKTRDGSSPEDIDRRYNEVMGGNSSLPGIFRDDLPKY